MSDTIDTTVEAIKENPEIAVPRTAAAAVVVLAIYGAQDLTRKGVRKVTQIRENRKAKKAEEKAVDANNTPSQS
jgi:hypothetical protein